MIPLQNSKDLIVKNDDMNVLDFSEKAIEIKANETEILPCLLSRGGRFRSPYFWLYVL